jgi:HTH-type transcriptional regulator/antitoxin HigA
VADKLRPFRPVTPGEILRDELDARGWTQSDLAEILGRPVQTINEIVSGKKAIVPTTAVELSRAFGTSPEFWLNLESAYRLDLLHHEGESREDIARRARIHSLVPLKDLQKKGWISKTEELDRIEREVCRLLEIKSIQETPMLTMAARKSGSYAEFSPAQVAWACRARQMARRRKAKPFDRRRFNTQVVKLPCLSGEDDASERIAHALSDLGVRLVIVEHLPKTHMDGGAFWLDTKSPVVALSLRYDRIDNFWFTLMHELAHIWHDVAHATHLDEDLVGPTADAQEDKPVQEQKADTRANAWLLDEDDLNAFIRETKPRYSKSAILAFANRAGVHPGIVVGRLQHLGEIPYSHNRRMLVKVREPLLKALISRR